MLLELQVVLKDVHWDHVKHAFGSPDSRGQVFEVWDVYSHENNEDHDEEHQQFVKLELTLLFETSFYVLNEDIPQHLQCIVDVLHDVRYIILKIHI